MSTEKCFVHSGDWDAETRKHPALAWFEPTVNDIFDVHKWDTPYSELYTEDLELLKPDGTIVRGGKEAWTNVAELFGPFIAQHTQPSYVIIYETSYGWDMISTADIFGNLPGNPVAGEPSKVRDLEGKEWDCKLSGGFRFQFVKDAGGPRDGILLKLVQIMADSAPVLMRMLQRGVVKPADLGLG